MQSKRIVFDTAGFLAGLQNLYQEVFTTRDVLDEVKDLNSYNLLLLSIEAGKIKVLDPSKQSMTQVTDITKSIGEYSLTNTDLSVIALAVDLRPSIVITDDMSIINILNYLKIEYKTVKLRKMYIKKKVYKYVCDSCKKEYNKYYSQCPICGGKLLKSPR